MPDDNCRNIKQKYGHNIRIQSPKNISWEILYMQKTCVGETILCEIENATFSKS